MKKQDVLDLYGGPREVAESIGLGRTAVVMWKDIIPAKWALYFDQHTELEFDKRYYQNGQNNAGEGP
jgi:hypothetical protein